MNEIDRIKLSKKLSYYLRHSNNSNLNIQSNGYININNLLNLNDFNNITINNIIEVINKCDKKRFEMILISNIYYIRACQGHSINNIINDNELLIQINENDLINYCIHGTYYNKLELIKLNGLNRMKRNHIHFAEALPGENGVISGMRSNCDVIITVDMKAAMKDGIKFFRSTNNVILSPGLNDTGSIPPEYFVDITIRNREPKQSQNLGQNQNRKVSQGKSRVQHLGVDERKLDQSLNNDNSHNSHNNNNNTSIQPQTQTWATRLKSSSTTPITEPELESLKTSNDIPTLSSSSEIDYYCVIDFEATCLNNVKINPQEIIEFPAVMINARTMNTVESELGIGNGVYHSYVKPIHHPILSQFCTELTGIEQHTVNSAPTFPTVYYNFLLFLLPYTRNSQLFNDLLTSNCSYSDYIKKIHSNPKYPRIDSPSLYTNIIFVSHGNYEFQNALRTSSSLHSMNSIVEKWLNIKTIYCSLPRSQQNKKNSSKRSTLGMAGMLKSLGIPLIGRHHSGIDDTRNIVSIFLELYRRGGDLTLYTSLDDVHGRT